MVDDPLEMSTDMGTVVSNEHKQKVEGFIKKGVEAGAHLELGGGMPKKKELTNGSFVMPVIFSDLTQSMEIVQQEIFGPVSAVLPFNSDEQMLEMVEGTKYGLIASLWTKDIARGTQLASKLNAGTVWINEHLMGYAETPSYNLTGMTKKPWYNLFNPHPSVQ